MPYCVIAQLGKDELEAPEVYRATLEGMIAKRWLKVVTEDKATRLARLRTEGWLVRLDAWWVPDTGDIDFTRTGYAQYRRALREEKSRIDDSLDLIDERAPTFHVISGNRLALQRRLTFLFADNEKSPLNTERMEEAIALSTGSKLVRVVKIDEPVRVGRWLEREANPHKTGWMVSIHYRH